MTSTFETGSSPNEVPHYASRPMRESGRLKRAPPAIGRDNPQQNAAYRTAQLAEEGAWSDGLSAPRLRQASPRPLRRSSESSARIWRSAVAAAALAALTLLIFPPPLASWISEVKDFAEPLLSRANAPVEANAPHGGPKSARLAIAPVAPARAGEAVPLGVSVPSPEGGFIVVAGLPQGASLSAGARADDDSWWLSFADLAYLSVRPAPDFVGVMDLSIELRLADASVSDRKTHHIEWMAVGLAAADGAGQGVAAQNQTAPAAALLPLGQRSPLAPVANFERPAFNAAAPAAATPLSAEAAPASASSKTAEKADEKAEPASPSGRLSGCFVKIDGRIIVNGRCHILKTAQRSVTFEPGRKPITLVHERDRIWSMTWEKQRFGKVFSRGPCWGSDRVYICERSK